MKKNLIILVALIFALPIFAQTTIYLNTGGSTLWNQGSAKFVVWYWNSDETTSEASEFMTLAPGETDIYKTTINLSSSDIAGVIFLRLNSATTSFTTWDDSAIWNKTDDETPSGSNCFTVASWGDAGYSTGSWSTYTEAAYSVSVDAPSAAFANEALTITATTYGYTSPTTTITVKTPNSSSYSSCSMPYTPTEAGTYSFNINVSEADGSEAFSQTAEVEVYNLPTNAITIKAAKPTAWTNSMYIYYWYENGAAIAPVAMTPDSDGWYSYEISKYYGSSINVIFINGSAWGNGQTEDIEGITTNTCYSIVYNIDNYTATAIDCSTDVSSSGEIDGPDSAVPNQCGDVMLQGFYWNSYSSTTYGTTKWSDLISQANEISAYFDMVWLPPSASSDGGLGYHPRQWSNQNSDLGTSSQLKTLIELLHDGGAKVLADVVTNHRASKSSWCDFYEDDFDGYGKYQFTADHIVKDDEMNSDSSAGDCYGAATGAYDTGEQYGSARDLDHTSSYVQNAVIAYLKWLRTEVGYDGFRYDVGKGFSANYFDMYNQAARPEFSVAEYYDGDASTLQWWIQNAGYNSLLFDFATKFSAFNGGIASDNYSALQGSGLLGAGYSKYAVTFIDNHDTFERDENDNDFQSITSSEKILHANAFILSMPGIPCVFYPHWYTYKEDLKPMIEARRAAGVHSESAVTDEYVAYNRYECTVQGTNGYLILRIGSGSDYNTVPSGYTKVASGTNYAILIQSNLADAIEPVMFISPEGGKYIGGTTVEITATQDATIYYTLDGTEPTTSSTKYTAPISITTNNTVLKAFASTGSASCAVQTNTYVTEIEPRTEPIVVKLYKPDSWSYVYMWAWDDDGNQLFPTSSSAVWPGEAINNDGDGWWSYSFDLTVNTVNLVFNEGTSSGDQTGDVLGLDDSACFEYSKSGMEPNTVDCDTVYDSDSDDTDDSYNPATNVDITTSNGWDVIGNNGRIYISGEGDALLRIFNITGQMVVNTTFTSTFEYSLEMGIYIISINNNVQKISVY